MKQYRINYDDGYIASVVAGVGPKNANCTEAEYQTVRAMLLAPPVAPEGQYYRLRDDLQWELTTLPEIREEATEGDYIAALGEMGVSL